MVAQILKFSIKVVLVYLEHLSLVSGFVSLSKILDPLKIIIVGFICLKKNI